MNDKDIRSRARQFSAELKVADQPGIFDKLVGRNLATLEFLKARVRWKGIISILTRAGARREDGKSPLSEDQLRASYSRMHRRLAAPPGDSIKLPDTTIPIAPPIPSAGSIHSHERARPARNSKDVSDEVIQGALDRIGKYGTSQKKG